eukprot:7843171-Pyramimonas_sp.AAC.1
MSDEVLHFANRGDVNVGAIELLGVLLQVADDALGAARLRLEHWRPLLLQLRNHLIRVGRLGVVVQDFNGLELQNLARGGPQLATPCDRPLHLAKSLTLPSG